MAKINKSKRPIPGVPDGSTSDIAFLLLIFFIVSTVFVKEKIIKVKMPKAESIDKIPRNHAVTIYVTQAGQISIDDYALQIPDVSTVMTKKLNIDYNVISCFRTDENTNYGLMADIMNQLRNANCLRVSFEAKRKI